jgi:hypothetical protein
MVHFSNRFENFLLFFIRHIGQGKRRHFFVKKRNVTYFKVKKIGHFPATPYRIINTAGHYSQGGLERDFALVFLRLATRKLLNVSHRARLPKNRKSKKNAHNMITIKYRAFMAR